MQSQVPRECWFPRRGPQLNASGIKTTSISLVLPGWSLSRSFSHRLATWKAYQWALCPQSWQKTLPRRSPYQCWKFYQEEVLLLSKTACGSKPTLFPSVPSSNYFRNYFSKQLVLKFLICSLVSVPKKSSISLFSYFSLVGGNGSQPTKVCLPDSGRKRG